MPVSFSETLEVACPRCGNPFAPEVWLIVDARERPDLVAKILDGTLHDTHCPSCGQAGQAPAPLLYHNRYARRVLFAVPPGMAEDEWRAAAEGLLWTLVGALPESLRDPYLGELQAEAGLAGVAAVLHAEGLAEADLSSGEDLPPIVQAIQALLAADGADEIQRVLQQHTILLDPQAVAILRELAREARKQAEDEAAAGFSRAAEILDEVRAQGLLDALRAPASQPAQSHSASPDQDDPLDELAYALLRSHTGPMLAETVDQYPQLLDATIDEDLAAWSARAQAHGKSRLAQGIDERREALRSMRAQYDAERPVFEAVEALLRAGTADDLEHVLVEHDALYTDAADAVLDRLAASADPELAAHITERRVFLKRIRNALDSQAPDASGE